MSREGDNLEEFLARVRESLADGSFVRLVVRPQDRESAREGEDSLRRIDARLITLRGQPMLSLTLQSVRQARVRNLPVSEGIRWLESQIRLGSMQAYLATTRRDWQWRCTPRGARLIGHRPSVRVAPPRTHDRPRHRWLEESAHDWLRALGLVDAEGEIRAAAVSKYQQIERFLEVFSHHIRTVIGGKVPGYASRAGQPGQIGPGTADARLGVVDAGCGKGYLTFAVWHLLHRVWAWPVRVLGIETRAELVKAARGIAERMGAAGLEFVHGDVETVALSGMDVMMALHACNTATDAALLRGVEHGARLLMVAPCCHQEIRPQLRGPEPWAGVLRHGLLKDRFAAWLTDALRVLYLEWAGYRVRVVEFVDPEHTPRNLLLVCVRVRRPFSELERRDRIVRLKEEFGVRFHAMDPLLDAPPANLGGPVGHD